MNNLINKIRMPLLAVVVALSISVASCGAGNFAGQLRVILAASGPLIESLNLGERKQLVVVNFTELAGDAADLSDAIKACGNSKPCKLDAVVVFKEAFDRIALRGTFSTHPKLQRVGDILDGLISSARIYYGERRPQVAGRVGQPVVTEADISEQLKQLKAAMQP